MIKALIPFAVLSATSIYLGAKSKALRKEVSKLREESHALRSKKLSAYSSLTKKSSEFKRKERDYKREIAELEYEVFILKDKLKDKTKESIDSYCDQLKKDLTKCANNNGTPESIMDIFGFLSISVEKCIKDIIKEEYEDYAAKRIEEVRIFAVELSNSLISDEKSNVTYLNNRR